MLLLPLSFKFAIPDCTNRISLAMNLVHIITYNHYIDAHIAKAKLESEGIQTVLFDECVSNFEVVPTILGLGVRLHVLKEDVDASLALLGDFEHKKNQLLCPYCESTKVDIVDKTLPKIAKSWVYRVFQIMIGLFFFIVPPFISGEKYHCQNCHKDFVK